MVADRTARTAGSRLGNGLVLSRLVWLLHYSSCARNDEYDRWHETVAIPVLVYVSGDAGRSSVVFSSRR